MISYTVAQRTNEFGIRMALGAGQYDVLGLVMKRGLRLAMAGILLGAAGALRWRRCCAGLFRHQRIEPGMFVAMADCWAVLRCWPATSRPAGPPK